MTKVTPPFATLPPPNARPIPVEVWRGDMVESRHAVSCAVVDADGDLVAGWGDVAAPIYPRSAIKPFQAIPLVESGAVTAFTLGNIELALACASHGGEPAHVAAVWAWLNRLGIDQGLLECGPQWPYHEASMLAMAAAGRAPDNLHNNCSGKHAGMISTALHLGEPIAGYVDFNHPVQQRILAACEELCGLSLRDAPRGIDGCSIPTIAIPLRAFAFGMARFGTGHGLGADRAAACARLYEAMAREPFMLAGSDKFGTALGLAAGNRLVAKVGAEGVFAAAWPEQGLGIVVKAQDGAVRAAEVALAAILDWLGALDESMRAAIEPYARPVIANRRGLAVGGINAAGGIAF